MKISSTRAEARKAGAKRYFDGRPCQLGHIAERLTSSGKCLPCNRLLVAKYRKTAQGKKRMAEYHRQHYIEHREKLINYQSEYRKEHPEKLSEDKKRWYQKNKLQILKRFKEYRQANAEKLKEYHRNFYQANKSRLHAMMREKRNSNPSARILHSLRGRFYKWLHYGEKYKSLTKLIGCGPTELRQYLELQFQPGMTWINYGYGENKWNVDHVIPISRFDAKSPIDQAKGWHYTNLQPMWQIDNFKKGNRSL